MDEPLVLILNPLNLPLKHLIIESINKLDNIKYKSIDCNDGNLNQICPCPSLVLVLIGNNCDGECSEKWKLPELHNTFPLVPIYYVVDTSCTHCLNCQDYAWGIIHTPFKKEDIQFIIHWHIKSKSEDNSKSIKHYIKKRSILDLFVGESPAAIKLKNRISKVAPLDITILLQGETGTGKELTAKLIHHLSDRAKKPFIAVNCGAIPNELFENELFGHKRGAYTNADKSEKGLIYAAERGTLFLDEIESMPITSQVKLLRFIEDKQYKPLGQSSIIYSDVRIISAANRDLIKLVEKGEFREDLFYRLLVVNIFIPPLRDRKEDIPLLARYFVERFTKLFSKNIECIKPEALMYLTYFSWPGNTRQLENLLQEAVILSESNFIEKEHLNFRKYNKNINYTLHSFEKTKKEINDEFEKKYLERVLDLFNGNVSKASQFAEKDRRDFYRLIKKHKIEPNIFRLVK